MKPTSGNGLSQSTLATFHSVCNAKLPLLIGILLNLRLLPNYSVQQMAEGCLSVDSVLIKVSLGFVGVNSPGLLMSFAVMQTLCRASHSNFVITVSTLLSLLDSYRHIIFGSISF